MLEVTEPKSVWRAYTRMSQLLAAEREFGQLPPHTASLVEKVMSEGVTPEIQALAKQAPKKEWERYQLLRIIGNGNPNRLEDLTELAMDEIRMGLEEGNLP